MVKLRKGILALLVVCGLAGAAYGTGGVVVYGTWARGDMGTAHNASGSHYIGCWTNSDTVGPPLLYCEANDGAGNMNFCYTQNANMVNVAQTIQTVSEVSFAWDPWHGCNWITVNNTSGPPGRKQ